VGDSLHNPPRLAIVFDKDSLLHRGCRETTPGIAFLSEDSKMAASSIF
jgi:hypothetical protein